MKIRWGRVIILALALEAVMFAVFLPIQSRLSPRAWLVAVGCGAVVFSYAAGWLAGRGLRSHAAVNGFLVGAIETAIYLALNIFGPGGIAVALGVYGLPLFIGLNVAKIAATTAGALHAKLRGGRLSVTSVF